MITLPHQKINPYSIKSRGIEVSINSKLSHWVVWESGDWGVGVWRVS